MSSLYQLVDKVLNEESPQKARQLLYGDLTINGQEYYENIVSQFVRKKEIFVSKNNQNIVFDLKANVDNIWNIVFIGEYILKLWDEKKNKINKEKELKGTEKETHKNRIKELNKFLNNSTESEEIITEKYKKEIDSIIQEYKENNIECPNNIIDILKLVNDKQKKEYDVLHKECIDLNDSYMDVDRYFSNIEKYIRNGRVILEGVQNSDVDLSSAINELQKAVVIIDKLRNGFNHRNKKLKLDEIISIDNALFVVDIPASYISGFNAGKIIVKEKDRDLINKVDDISFPIMESLNYDPRKIQSFFYNTRPNTLKTLLSLCDNNVSLLYQMPNNIFHEEPIVIKTVFEYSKRCGAKTINEFTNFYKSLGSEYILFISRFETIKNYNIDYIIYYLDYFIHHKDLFGENEINWLIEDKYLEHLNVVKDYFEYILSIDISAEYAINDSVPFDVHNLKTIYDYVKNNNLNITDQTIIKLHKKGNANNIVNVLSVLLRNDINREYIINDFFDVYNDSIDVTNLVEIINKLKELSIPLFELPNFYKGLKTPTSQSVEKYWNIILKNDYTHLLKNLIMSDENIDTIHKLIENRNELNLTIEEIFSLPSNAYDDYDDTKNKILYLNNYGELRSILFNCVFTKRKRYVINFETIMNIIWDDFEENIHFLSQLLDKYDIAAINYSLFSRILINKDKFIKIEEFLSKKLLNKNYIFDYFTSLFYTHYGNIDEVIQYIESGLSNGMDFQSIMQQQYFDMDLLSGVLFEGNYLDMDDNELLPDFSINNKSDRIKEWDSYFEKKRIDVDSSNSYIGRLFVSPGYKVNWDNIDILLSRVNNDYNRLSEFPDEMFTCDTGLLKELLVTYNSNICMSIFGIDEPKKISVLVYTNSVLTNLNDDNDFEDLILPNANSFVSVNKEDSLEYLHMSEEQYNQQFKYDDRGNVVTDISKYIITMLRNSSAHFRFKSIKDENNNILEDKIIIYDEDNSGNNCFNIVIDLKYLASIIRSIEEQLDKRKEEQDELKTSNSIGH